MIIKRVVVMVVVVMLGLLFIEKLIVPMIASALEMPGLATWTGLGGFLHLLPYLLVLFLLAVWVKGLLHKGADDE